MTVIEGTLRAGATIGMVAMLYVGSIAPAMVTLDANYTCSIYSPIFCFCDSSPKAFKILANYCDIWPRSARNAFLVHYSIWKVYRQIRTLPVNWSPKD